MNPTLLLTLYCLVIAAGSLLGGALPSWIRLTHTRRQLVISFVAGLMLGVSLFHMVPHAAARLGSLDTTMGWVVGGLLAMFFLIRAFHFHEHEHEHDAGADHEPRSVGWIGIAIGLGLHTVIDGVALSASVMAETMHEAVGIAGIGTFLAVLLHKPLDALAITSLMGGWTARQRLLVNTGFALMCPLGALLFYFGVGLDADAVVGAALAFAGGTFLCISLSDLLPELQFHAHDRVKLSAALLLGLGLAYAIGFLESAQAHVH